MENKGNFEEGKLDGGTVIRKFRTTDADEKNHETTPQIIIYEADDNAANVSVRIEDETVWLTQQQLAELFHVVAFFKKVQNKIHYAVHGHTAAELIYDRAEAEKEFMGLMTFSGSRPHLADAVIAKNYLDEKELRALGQIVSGYLDFAERQAERQEPMTMHDLAQHLDKILTATGERLLADAGRISHDQAVWECRHEGARASRKGFLRHFAPNFGKVLEQIPAPKFGAKWHQKAKADGVRPLVMTLPRNAKNEYVKYQAKTLSGVEQQYLATLKAVETTVKKRKP